MKKIVIASLVVVSLAFGLCDGRSECPLSLNCDDESLSWDQMQMCFNTKSDDALEKVRALQKKLVAKEIKEYSAGLEEMGGMAMEYMDAKTYEQVLNQEINATIDMLNASCTISCSALRHRFHNICYYRCASHEYTQLKKKLEKREKNGYGDEKVLVP